MKRILIPALLLASSVALAQENYSTNWSGHRTLGVNTTATGAATTTDAVGFPVLVRLGTADSNVFKNSKLTGADLRFTKSNNTTRLAHEIESWDSAGRSAAVWVRLDTVKGNATTELRMHWGNAAAADSSKGSAVFNSSNGFLAVWHMNTPIAAEGDTLRDATGNGNHAIADTAGAGALMPADTAGVIGIAKRFRGAAGTSAINTGGSFRVLNAANSLNLNTNNGPYTISVWANPAVCHATARITVFSKYANVNSGPTQGRAYALQTSAGTPAWRITNNPTAFYANSTTAAVGEFVADGTCTANAWTYLAGTYAATGTPTADAAGAANLKLFVDSTFSATTPATANQQPVSIGDSALVHIGRLHNQDRFMRGAIDELRVSNVSRSADWLKLEQATQKSGATAVATVPDPVALDTLRYRVGSTTVTDTLVNWSTGVAVNITPTYLGGPVDSFKVVAGTLPAGVTLNKNTGVLSGIPTAVTAAANQTIRAYGRFGGKDSTSRQIRTTVVLGPLGNLTYAPDTATYPVGIPVINVPTYTGRAPTKFAVVGTALPAGLALDTVTGVISGTATTQTAAANYTVRATNTTGPDTTTKVLRLTISAAENYTTGWSQHKDWWLNTQPNGSNVTTAVLNFPVLVRLDSNAINFAQTSNGGRDLRFTKANNTTRLPHQIDTWDSAGKKASVWVLVDTVPASGIKALRMHWGNASAVNASSGPTVFTSAAGFKAVWHMNGPTDTSNEPDATASGLTATQVSAPPVVAGIVGNGRNFANTGTTVADYFNVTGSATPLTFPVNGNFTISAWTNITAVTNNMTFISKHDNAYAMKINTQPSWEFFEFNAGWNAAFDATVPPPTGVWQHIAGVQNGVDAFFYVNGVQTNVGITATSSTTARNDAVDLLIGAEPQTNTTRRRPYSGMADEVRIAGASRNADWMRLEYENQKPTGQTLVTFTQPVSIGGVAARTSAFDVAAKSVGGGVLFQIRGAGESQKARITLVDVWGRTLWNRTVSTEGMSQVFWNGQANNGAKVSSGVYAVRVALLDASGKAVRSVERKVPFTR